MECNNAVWNTEGSVLSKEEFDCQKRHLNVLASRYWDEIKNLSDTSTTANTSSTLVEVPYPGKYKRPNKTNAKLAECGLTKKRENL